MGNDELASALREHSVHLDRSNKLCYLKLQKDERERTPTSVVFGSYFFNPTSATQLPVWRQLLQRNGRRKSVTFINTNQDDNQYWFSTNDTIVDVETLLNSLGDGVSATVTSMGALQLAQITSSNPVEIPTSEAIWVLDNHTGVEGTGVLSWFETIYSSTSADPNAVTANRHKEGDTQELEPSLASWLGEAKVGFGRGGVR